ncbi:N-alpha-acetyltransferase 25, NatB auxiliary subunit-like [Actinia tenebrosa]|uniref:N-alpha-acetyltransferase 25, NatB auxiliary subunit-like n=1 Tax=Actinia tenebrosa TaxID=6105 RepID=A0A6P8I270_ACTTE|nr:N-alpha-acetyltransferase 25, NatB auxiliary subunit-like [Actinia tenebrosa]
MAARHVDVNERRLRPVYDALDLMNNKQAIQLADKILKKQKVLHCAKVLKSLALLRSGRQAECAALMEEVVSAKPCDEPTLQAMTICFRELQKPEGVAKIYDAAVKQCPTNEEFHSHLFMAYVRISDYKKQQQAAMNLYKAFPKNPYYFWSVMSIVMQSIHCNDERLSKTMLLPLAERMIEKFVNEGKIDAEAEVHLYLMILESLQKYDKALEVLKGPLGEKLVSNPLEREEKQALYLMKMSRWADANIAYKKLIEKVPDQWSYYQSYFNSLTALIDENWKPSEDLENGKIPDHDIEQLARFLSSLKEEQIAKGKQACRGPFLAQLEVEKLFNEEKLKDTRQDSKALSELLVEYFERFGDKNCLFHDLTPYLYLLNKGQQEQFVEVLKKNLQGVSDDDPQSNHVSFIVESIFIAISKYL